ncbi:MAG: hypothetical protein V1775_14800 [Bacteroidota bacterium]
MERKKFVSFLKNMNKLATFSIITVMVSSCYYDNEEFLYPDLPGVQCDTTGITYSGFVAPLLALNCNSCHSEVSPSGNVVTSTYDGLRTVIESGRFRKAINHESGAQPMPQNGNKLSSCDLSKIDAWIIRGYPQN